MTGRRSGALRAVLLAGALLLAGIACGATTSAAAPAVAGGPASAAAGGADRTLTVGFDRGALGTRLGSKFGLTSVVRNDSDAPLAGVVAHLNVLSADPGVYVDPEDWSTSRTRYLDPVPAHGSVTLDWPMQAVNSGHFLVYVALARPSGPAAVTSSEALRLDVVEQQTLDAGGALPLAVAGPVLVGLVMLGVARRRTVLRRAAPRR